MRVARHEMPGKLANMIRPEGNGMIRGIAACFTVQCNTPSEPHHTVPYGTDPNSDAFLAMNCQATIIQSLRDKSCAHRISELSAERITGLSSLRFYGMHKDE